MHTATLLRSGFDDLETLAQIEDSDMKDLGIPPLHASRLRRTVAELKRAGRQRELDASNPVVAFLRDAGLEQYAASLLDSGFDDMEVLMLIEDSDLREHGFIRGHAVKLRKRLREYEAQQRPQLAAPLSWGSRAPAAPAPGPESFAQRPASYEPERRFSQGRDDAALFSAKRISLIERSWEQVSELGMHAVGGILMRHTFELAPSSKALFPMDVRRRYREWTVEEGDADEEDDGDLLESAALRKLFGRVISAVGSAVAGLHDMVQLVPMLTKLGARHSEYGVSEEHWAIIGDALDLTLRDILAEGYTEEVRQAWSLVYGFTSAVMIEGWRRSL